LRKFVDAKKDLVATKVRSLLHAAYARTIKAELSPTDSEDSIDASIRTNPVTAVSAMSEFKRARTRKLSQSELRELWLRVSSDSQSGHDQLPSRATRLAMLLGGQRCEQLLRVQNGDLDLDAGTILLMDLKGNRKQPRPHLLPLSKSAKAEAQWLIEYSRSCDSTYLVPGRTKGTSLSPASVSKYVRDICRDMLAKRQANLQFQFSDLRRTIETTMASLGVHKDIRAQVQSHGITGVQAKHYDMHDYMPEKRAALELWDRYLKSLVATDARNSHRSVMATGVAANEKKRAGRARQNA